MSQKYLPHYVHRYFLSLTRIIPYISLIVLLVDSRAPYLSEIYLKEIKSRWPRKKNILIIFTKSDLSQSNNSKHSFNLLDPASRRKILRLLLNTLRKLKCEESEIPNTLIVVGGSNSGKSSFINLLSSKVKTKRDATPGTTRILTRYTIKPQNLIIYDSPGIFPEKIDESTKSILCLLNFLPPSYLSEKSNFQEWGYKYIKDNYPDIIQNLLLPYSLSRIPIYPIFLKYLALKYRLIERGGSLSLNKAEAKFIQFLREGKLGPIIWNPRIKGGIKRKRS